MADQFIGLTVLVKLKAPPDAKVRGLVTKVVNQRLTLEKAVVVETGAVIGAFEVPGDLVEDLDIEQQTTKSPPAVTPHVQPAQAHLDPAILSFAKKPAPHSPVSQVSGHNLSYDSESFKVSPPHSTNEGPTGPRKLAPKGSKQTLSINLSSTMPVGAENLASATLTEPFSGLTLLNGQANLQNGGKEAVGARAMPGSSIPVIEGRAGGEAAKGRARRNRGKRNGNRNVLEAAIVDEPAGLEGIDRGPGWRQDPLTEPRRSTPRTSTPTELAPNMQLQEESSQQPGWDAPFFADDREVKRRNNRARPRKKGRRGDVVDQNGWATEEVTDIQDLGDFDFEGNLSKFDKKKVFEQIREEDTTADEARLVSFNRVAPRPGTYGGKNLHYTEMVLGSPTVQLEASSSSEDDNLSNAMENRISSRSSHRNQTQLAGRKGPSRKGSGITSGIAAEAMQPSLSNRGHKPSHRKAVRILRTAVSRVECPCISPLQMIELEQFSTSSLNITGEMMTENAAIAIAQTARKLCQSQVGQLNGDPTSRPVIVILAGNHKTGSRAIAAARQLRNHNAQVFLCVLGLDREADLMEDVRRQLQIFRSTNGKVVRHDQLFQRLKGASTNFIIDALFGVHLSFDDLRQDHQAAYLQLLRWSNSTNALTLSVDIPSGVDASTGVPSSSHESQVVIMADHVLSLGAPKTGLLSGMDKVDSFKNHLSWMVADIGISNAAWKKFGLRRQQGVDFGAEWVTTLALGVEETLD